MTFVAYTSKFVKKNKLFLLILFLALIFRLYRIQEAFIFDYDQQIPAEAAYDFFVSYKLSLIGQELSFPGFYLGPLHNWLQLIPYGLCNLKPDCVPYFYLTISLITIAILYWALKSIFSHKVTTVTTILMAFSLTQISMERGVNSNYFIILSSTLMLYCLSKFYKGGNKHFICGAFVAGVATVNFNPVFIFTSLAYFSSFFVKKAKIYKAFFVALIAFFINYAPLVFFNLRHENILVNNLAVFLSESTSTNNLAEKLYFMTVKVTTPFTTYYLFSNVNIFLSLIAIGLFITGLFYLNKQQDNMKYFIFLWPLLVIFLFLFYKGHIPDYYSQQIVLPIIIIISIAITKNWILTAAFLIVFSFQNLYVAYQRNYPINYQLKKSIVNYIINDSDRKTFNVYYDFPPGLNTGYQTLFKLNRAEPQENQVYLYIISASPAEESLNKYAETFKDKMVSEKDFNGVLRLVSVK